MIQETIRMIADTLASGSTGSPSSSVNLLLPRLPIDAGDSVPPLVTVVADETRDDASAQNRYPESFPCLVVNLMEGAQFNAMMYSNVRDAEIPILIRYIYDNNVSTAKGRSAAYVTLRAVQQCLADFLKTENLANRVRNQVQIIEMKTLEHLQVTVQDSDNLVTSALKVTLFCRDTAAVTF